MYFTPLNLLKLSISAATETCLFFLLKLIFLYNKEIIITYTPEFINSLTCVLKFSPEVWLIKAIFYATFLPKATVSAYGFVY